MLNFFVSYNNCEKSQKLR